MRLLLRLAIVVGVAVGGFAQGQPVGMLVQGTMTRNAMYQRLFQEIAHFEADRREATGATVAALRTYQRQQLGLSDGEAAQLRAAAVDCVRQLRTDGLLDSQWVSRGADDSGMIRAAMISARVLSAVDALAAMGAEGFARLDSKVMQYLSTPVVLTSSPTGAGAAGGNLRSARSKGGAFTMLSGEGCSDPTPEIVDITPGSISYPWQAGGLQEFAISGTGFGTAPTITVSGDVGSYGVYHGSDTSISAWVDLTSSMGGSASVSVTSNGYTGNGFIEGSEHNSPTSQSETAQIAAPPTPSLSCPQSVTRGGTVTCTIYNANAASVSGWSFSGGGGAVPGPSGTLTWSGVMVTSGTVTANVSGVQLTASIAVNPRSWHTAAPSPVLNTAITLRVPPLDFPDLGHTVWTWGQIQHEWATVPGGPNSGFTYYTSPLTFTDFSFGYNINSDLADQGSLFSKHQCGQSGYIGWSNLHEQTVRHEYNSNTQSHWAFYKNSMDAHNPGDYYEGRVAPPNTNIQSFNDITVSQVNALASQINADGAVEPYGCNVSETGQLLGYVNWGLNYNESCRLP